MEVTPTPTMGATAFVGANDCRDLRFGSEQPKPRVGQQVNVATVARAKDGMARHNLHAFGNILRLHGAMSEDHTGSGTLASRLFMVLLGPYHLRAHPGNLDYYYSPSRCIENRDRQMLVFREPFEYCSYPHGEAFPAG
jgi:hypothetical protein